MEEVSYISRFVVENSLAVLPLFLLSVGLGILVYRLELTRFLRPALDARPLVAILLATAIGAFSPFCSCTVIPVVAGLLMAGVPLPPVMAFWVASPTMDPEIFTLTVAMLGWPMAIARLVAALLLSLLAGWVTHLISKVLENPLRPGSALLQTPGLSVGPGTAAAGSIRAPVLARLRTIDWRILGRETLGASWNLGRWLVLAFVAEALILRYVPQATIASTLGVHTVWSVPLAAFVGIPLYMNNLTALPIVQGLLQAGMAPGAAIAFLMAGPVTTVPAMLAVRPLVRDSVFFLYLGTGLLGSILIGMTIGGFF